jgi:DNA adenine methylase
MKPLVKWSGGKGAEIPAILPHIPSEYDTYIEPFIGGGALYFHLNPQNAVIADCHTELVKLYKCVGKGQSPEIIQFMRDHPNDEETYYQVRNMECQTDIEYAMRFYYTRKTAYRGMLRYNKNGGFNVPFGRYKTCNWDALTDPNYQELLGRTEILHADFRDIFARYNDPSNFMFLDPPYDSAFTDYGYCKFGRDDHHALAELFKQSNNKCLMVIGATDFIEQLYDGFITDRYPKNYKFRLHSGRVTADNINTDHLVIRNY